jgi:quinol-cytochrome oxidoreductase complex cytochrome b subunit
VARPEANPGAGAAPGGILGRLWRSIFRGPLWPRSDRERAWVVFNHLVLHFRPIRLPEKTLRYTHTFGLGGMCLVLLLLLASSGALLMFVYEPTPGGAHDSIVSLQEEVVFGRLVRNAHYWGANLLIAVAVLHLLRVFFTGAFHAPRQFNWVIGLLLLLCILVSNFTGYLLPWDQLSYWAITICARMLGYVPGVGAGLRDVVQGGSEVGRATLINFYTLHTTLVPVCLIVLMAFHFWRVRKAKGVVVPRPADQGPEERPATVLALPHLLLRELVVGLALVASVLLLSVFFEAPLGDPANPGMSPNPAKAPWYFLGLQELLLHFHPFFAVVVLPLLATTLLVLLPYLRYDTDTGGIWFASHTGRKMAAVSALAALVVTPAWVLADELWLDFPAWLPGVPAVIGNGLLPAGILLATLGILARSLRKRHAASRNETLQAAFVFLAVVLAVLTATGVWFRGPGMALVSPLAGLAEERRTGGELAAATSPKGPSSAERTPERQ